MRALTIERALAAASKAGATFRLAGSGVGVRDLAQVPPFVADFLRERREDVFAALGGSEHDRPCLELLKQLQVELVYCTEDAAGPPSLKCSPMPATSRWRSTSRRRRGRSTPARSHCG